jgi:7-carboxy-7-deazaguanine synthase
LAWFVDAPACFKVVCRDAADVVLLADLADRYGLPADRVWVMPEGIDAATLVEHLAAVVEPAIGFGFNVTTRLHVEAWGNRRGV